MSRLRLLLVTSLSAAFLFQGAAVEASYFNIDTVLVNLRITLPIP